MCQIEHSRHRSVFNFLVNLMAALAAYTYLPKKPSIVFTQKIYLHCLLPFFSPVELTLTLHAPFAYAICLGKKDTKYHSRYTNIRNWILIHAGRSTLSDDAFEDYGITPHVERSVIIGAAKIIDCECYAPGEFGYVIGDYKLFNQRFQIKGKQPIFWSPADASEQRIFAAAWQLINKG